MATLTVDGYKGTIKIGSGSIDEGGTDVTFASWTATESRVADRRRLTFVVTSGNATHAGRSWTSRVVSDNGAGVVTLVNPCPFLA